ncbi:MAG: hypothetical protein ACPGRD_10615, partial [Planktomarina sp.]
LSLHHRKESQRSRPCGARHSPYSQLHATSRACARQGQYKLGKSCLYINKLADVDQDVLAEIIRIGLDDLATRWSVNPS